MRATKNMKLVSVIDYFEAIGTSWTGNVTKRDGKLIGCGHKHRTKSAAERCVRRMEREQPGNCQQYKVGELRMEKWRKPRA